uniref:Death domain-containing protein n=1 Tax=Amphimedon queenslandica TaxID=400682 RepID=A0A1X7T862_AMPQE
MSLKITFTSKHTLHLINRYTHIEVYFTGPAQHCPLVRKLLTTAIDNSSDAMHLKHNYINAFACPNNESCYCIVNEDHHKVADCTVCGESPALSNDYWTWFDDAQRPVESNNGTQTKQDDDQLLNDNLLLDKKPQKSDLLRLFNSFAAHYMIIGTALDVQVNDLLPTPGAATTNLILMFERWIDSNKGVTWRTILKVCKDYSDLKKAEAEVKQFLSSPTAHSLYDPLPDESKSIVPSPTVHSLPDESKSIVPLPTAHSLPDESKSIVPSPTAHSLPDESKSIVPSPTVHSLPHESKSIVPSSTGAHDDYFKFFPTKKFIFEFSARYFQCNESQK